MMDLGRRDFFAKFTRDDLYLVPPTVMHYLYNWTFVGLSFGIFESVGTELIFPKPIRNPSDFGSEPKLMLPLRSDGHPRCNYFVFNSHHKFHKINCFLFSSCYQICVMTSSFYFNNIIVIFSQILFSHELYNFLKITFHAWSNHDKKNNEFHIFSNINSVYSNVFICKTKAITTTFQHFKWNEFLDRKKQLRHDGDSTRTHV